MPELICHRSFCLISLCKCKLFLAKDSAVTTGVVLQPSPGTYADDWTLCRKSMIYAAFGIAEPCRTGGLVPRMREIKGSVLGRLPYYLVWQLLIALFFFLLFLLYLTLLIIAYIIVFVIVSSILLFCNCFFILLFCNYFLYLLLYSLNCCILSI